MKKRFGDRVLKGTYLLDHILGIILPYLYVTVKQLYLLGMLPICCCYHVPIALSFNTYFVIYYFLSIKIYLFVSSNNYVYCVVISIST